MKTLALSERDNKKPNQLRESGITPIALVELGSPTRKLQANANDLAKALAIAKDARVLQVQVNGETQPRTVFIKQIDRIPFSTKVLTVTLNLVTKTELMTVEVPILAVGTPLAVLQGTGVLVNTTSTIKITGNYTDLPSKIEVDTSKLEPNDTIHAGDINLPKGTTLASPSDSTLFMIQQLRGVAIPEDTPKPAVVE